jgi:hypothetical protein
MRVRNTTTCALGLAAALTLWATSLAAQDTTRLRTTSSQRINVSKGEVELRVDTVFLTRYDTIRVDNTIVRVDTVTVAAPAPIIPPLSEWYWGLFAGATSPAGDFDNLYTNGFHFGGAVGWDPRESWFGARLSAYLSQVGREQGRLPILVGTGTPLIWSGELDGKVKAPLGGWAPYLIGGLGFNSFKRIATVADVNEADVLIINADTLTVVEINDLDTINRDDAVVCGTILDGHGNCFRLANTDSWRTKFQWNFGLGTDFRIGSQEMFFEVRWVTMATSGSWTWFVPVSLGLRYF